jgi:hypothetical protein
MFIPSTGVALEVFTVIIIVLGSYCFTAHAKFSLESISK